MCPFGAFATSAAQVIKNSNILVLTRNEQNVEHLVQKSLKFLLDFLQLQVSVSDETIPVIINEIINYVLTMKTTIENHHYRKFILDLAFTTAKKSLH